MINWGAVLECNLGNVSLVAAAIHEGAHVVSFLHDSDPSSIVYVVDGRGFPLNKDLPVSFAVRNKWSVYDKAEKLSVLGDSVADDIRQHFLSDLKSAGLLRED